MAITTLSSREVNQDVAGSKKAAQSGPAITTDRGKAAHVLFSIEDSQRITQQSRKIADPLATPGDADIAFDPGQVEIVSRPADLS